MVEFSDVRIKLYAKWIEFILKQALYPDQMKNFILRYPIWFWLVRVGLLVKKFRPSPQGVVALYRLIVYY
jgi:hypothetical protein